MVSVTVLPPAGPCQILQLYTWPAAHGLGPPVQKPDCDLRV